MPVTENLGFARVDLDRRKRRGHPEAIFCEGKTTDQVLAIARSLAGSGAVNVLATRACPETLSALAREFPGAAIHARARLAVINPAAGPRTGEIVVAAWRNADEPAAEEAAVVAESMGSRVTRRYDVPLDVPEALPSWGSELGEPNVIVVADGSGAALATVVSGLTRCLVVALPTSAAGPVPAAAALLSALNTCSPGVLVTNIDNGYGAGYAAHLINVSAAVSLNGEIRAEAADLA